VEEVVPIVFRPEVGTIFDDEVDNHEVEIFSIKDVEHLTWSEATVPIFAILSNESPASDFQPIAAIVSLRSARLTVEKGSFMVGMDDFRLFF